MFLGAISKPCQLVCKGNVTYLAYESPETSVQWYHKAHQAFGWFLLPIFFGSVQDLEIFKLPNLRNNHVTINETVHFRLSFHTYNAMLFAVVEPVPSSSSAYETLKLIGFDPHNLLHAFVAEIIWAEARNCNNPQMVRHSRPSSMARPVTQRNMYLRTKFRLRGIEKNL